MNGAAMSVARDHRAAAQRQTRFREPGPRQSRTTSGAAAISPDGRSAWVPSQAGQRQARHAPRRPGAQLPEHGARHQLAHRPRQAGAEDLCRAASTTTTPASRARRLRPRSASTCSSRSRPAARWPWSTRYGGSELFRVRRRARAAGSRAVGGRQAAVRQQLHGPHARRLRPFGAARDGHRRRAAASRPRPSHATEKLAAQVLLGKQLFYDAQDTRLARDAYMSCASCHNDGGHDGRIWDLTGFGEGLRNTIEPARPRPARRASCTGATTSTRCRTSRARSATSPAAPG